MKTAPELDRAMRSFTAAGEIPIPPYPAVAMRLQQAVSRPDFGLAEVARLVSSDAVLAASVLRCANSAIYSRGGPASTLTQAVTRIGARQVMRLVLAASLAGPAQAAGALATARRICWIEALASAAICQELARFRSLKPEEAFLAGLLHDFGKVVACSCLEALLAKELQPGSWPLAALVDCVDEHHLDLGNRVAERWQLPDYVCAAIARHHERGGECADIIELVKASDEVVGMLIGRSQVSAADLAPVRSLVGLAEREAVARTLEKLPEFVASLERATSQPETHSAQVILPETTLSGQRPVSFGVTVGRDRSLREYLASAICASGVSMVGKEPLAESRLMEVTLHGPPEPLRIWALTRLSRREGDGYRIELQPFALKGTERVFWDHLLTSA